MARLEALPGQCLCEYAHRANNNHTILPELGEERSRNIVSDSLRLLNEEPA